MEKEKVNNVEFISDVLKNGVEAGLKIASKHYHLITDLQQLVMEKEKVFRMLGEQVFQMIDQGRIFAPAIMQATFRTAKEIIERIAHLEEEALNKRNNARNSKEKTASVNSEKTQQPSRKKASVTKSKSNVKKPKKSVNKEKAKKANMILKKKKK